MVEYDQRWVRRIESAYKSASSKHLLCASCGFVARCKLPKIAIECGQFMPVLSFRSRDGLDAGLFNTFRRGPGWYRRVPLGARVRLYAADIEEFVGEGRVSETHVGALGPLLGRHASFNHLMLERKERAETDLLRVLVTLYGRNYATPIVDFSVIYIERT